MAELAVMTWNLYVGSDFEAVFSATSVDELLAGAGAVYEQILAEIARIAPDLIGLQEMALFRSAPLADPSPPETMVLDYLQLLLAALAARGVPYSAVGEMAGIDAQLPRDETTRVRLTIRDVLLLRDGADVERRETQTGTYAAATRFDTAAGPIEFPRSWVSLDAEIDGSAFRMITTHLEVPTDDDAQTEQASELLKSQSGSDVPTIVVGDLNAAAPDSAVHRAFLDDGFVDAWAAANPDEPGLTCCQEPQLRNDVSALHERIDYVLLRGPFEVLGVTMVGDGPSSKTASGLWPSDHAGLAATIRLRS